MARRRAPPTRSARSPTRARRRAGAHGLGDRRRPPGADRGRRLEGARRGVAVLPGASGCPGPGRRRRRSATGRARRCRRGSTTRRSASRRSCSSRPTGPTDLARARRCADARRRRPGPSSSSSRTARRRSPGASRSPSSTPRSRTRPAVRLEVVRTSARLGHAAALNCRDPARAAAPVVVLRGHERRAAWRPRDAARRRARRPDGGRGRARSGSSPTTCARSRSRRPGTVDVVAIEGYAQAFRRADYVARGPLDEHFAFYRNLDIWWSLVLRDPFAVDDDERSDEATTTSRRRLRRGPRVDAAAAARRVRVDGLDVVRHEHRGWTSVSRGRARPALEAELLPRAQAVRDAARPAARGRVARVTASRRRHGRARRARRPPRRPSPRARRAARRRAPSRAPPAPPTRASSSAAAPPAGRRPAAAPDPGCRMPRRGRGRARARGRRRARASGARRRGRSARSVSRTTASAVGRSRSSSIAATNRSWSAAPGGDRGAAAGAGAIREGRCRRRRGRGVGSAWWPATPSAMPDGPRAGGPGAQRRAAPPTGRRPAGDRAPRGAPRSDASAAAGRLDRRRRSS